MTDPPASTNAFERDLSGTNARTDAEAAIEELRQRGGIFVDAVRATRMAMALTDPTLPGNPIVFANQSFLDLTGYSMDEVLGQQPFFMNGPDTDPDDAERFRRILEEDRDGVIETVQYAKDGRRFVATVLLTAFKDDEGHTLNHFLSWADVTRRVDAEDDVADLQKAQAALRESERKYRTLFDSIDEGFCVVEMLFDDAGRPADYVFLETNPAFERQTGLVDAVHKRMRELAPEHEQHWFDIYGRIAKTGESRRFARPAEALGRWYDVYAFRVGRPEQRHVAILFNDISERRRADAALRASEERQAFLLTLGDEMRLRSTAEEKIEVAARLLGERLNASRVLFTEYDWTRNVALTFSGWIAEGAEPFVMIQELKEYEGEVLNDLKAGRLVRVDEIGARIKQPAYAEIASLGVQALLSPPLLMDGKLKVNLSIHQHEPRHWSEEEVLLVQEVAERLWAEVARARSEAALRESEEKYRTLFDTIDSGYALTDNVRDEEGRVVDLFGVDFNRSYTRHSGLPPFAGRRASEVITVEPEWLRQFEEVTRAGVPARYENYIAERDRWVSTHYSLVGDLGSDRVAVMFDDITDRKRAEAALRESEERQAFLLKLTDAIRSVPNEQALIERAVQMLAEALAVDRAYATRHHPAEDLTNVVYEVRGPDLAPLPATLRFSDFPEAGRQTFEKTLVFDDTANDQSLTAADKASLASMGVGAFLSRPLRRDGSPIFALGVVSTLPRRWTPTEIALVEEAAERTWEAAERVRGDAALRESEERLSTVFENMGEAFYLVELVRDDAGRVTDLRYLLQNRMAREWSGVSIIGRLLSEVNPEHDRAWLELFERVSETGEHERFEAFSDISARWHDYHLFPVGEDGDRVGILFPDITERKRAEAAQRESEERFRRFGEASQDVLWMREAETLQWIYLTPAFETIYGLAREEALKGDNYRSWLDLVVPEDREHAKGEIEKVLSGEHVTFEYRIKRQSDGRMCWLRETNFPVVNDAGEIAWIGGIGHDVTELRESEERRRTSEERFGLIVENARDYAIFTTDADGRIDHWYEGAAHVFGWTAEEAIGQHAEITFTPADRAEGAPAKERQGAARDGRVADVRWHIRKDGKRIFIDGVATAVRDSEGALTGFLKIGQDVTERRRAEERQNTLLAELQHRVRNIMAMIRSVARRTQESAEDVEEYAQHLEGRISAMARTQALLTRDVGAEVDLENLILDELQMQAAQPSQYAVTGPDVSLPAKAAEVLGLAIHELGTNSVKYGALSHQGGRIDVRWALLDGDGSPQLSLIWSEFGVRIEEVPGRSGFGTELITERVPYELHGTGALDFRSTGLVATIEFPLFNAPSILQTGEGARTAT